MKNILKKIQKALNLILAVFGLELIKTYPNERGVSIYSDVKFFLGKKEKLKFVDIGANIGQTTKVLRQIFPEGHVLSVEPDSIAFERLLKKYKNDKHVTCIQAFIGSEKGTTTFYRNTHSDMNSGLKRGRDAWGKIEEKLRLPVITLDDLAKSYYMNHVDFLKIDTQGFDFEVLKGAKDLFNNHSVDLVAIEHIFSEMYLGLPNLDEVLLFMREKNYILIAIYPPIYQRNKIGWVDILFASDSFAQKFKL